MCTCLDQEMRVPDCVSRLDIYSGVFFKRRCHICTVVLAIRYKM